MKKLLKKMKKVFIAFGASIVGFTSKVFGASDIFNEADKWLSSNYDTEIISEPMYGPPSPFENPIFVFRIISAIIIFIVGLVVLLNKFSKKTKIIIVMVLGIIFILLMFIILTLVEILNINAITY